LLYLSREDWINFDFLRLYSLTNLLMEGLSGFIFSKLIFLQNLLEFIGWVNISAHPQCRYVSMVEEPR
jgi:hypothetical protein